MSRYGFGLGFPGFRDAVSAFMKKRFGQEFNPLTEVAPLIERFRQIELSIRIARI